ncbi:TcpD family membrane protein [Enterococcus gallinarum]|uniref:TcpD family membrane protein n=1 Tax=Enterococcus gallinarum TaxID=1353 RepID=UPI00209069A5|nr:TcpD family membrane protein [Enterococcus gallinarum]MCO5478432.1 TcpD family membrane protein [Enterococcus gallinarum]
MLPEFGNLQSYAQGAVVSIIIIAALVLIVICLAKREFGALVVVVILAGVLIVFAQNPEGTMVKIAQGIINKLLNIGN